MSLFTTLCLIGVCYFIYKSVNKNRLTPEEKELLKVADANQITNEGIKMQFIKKEITLEKAIQSQKEKEKEAQRQAKAEKEAKEKAEKEIIDKLTAANHRTYFCYSLVNTASLLYLINPATNSVLESSKTNLASLYKEGWRLIDVDKTGRTAQLDAFNTVVRLEKTSN